MKRAAREPDPAREGVAVNGLWSSLWFHRALEDAKRMPITPHLFLATPCFGGLVTQGYMESVIALMQEAPSAGFDLSLALLGHDAMISRSRNTLVGHFLRHTVATHLLFIDADIAFAPESVTRLVRAEKDLVAGMYPIKALHWDEAARARSARGEAEETAPLLYVGEPCRGAAARREGDFITADFAGTGFMLIHRPVIERMIAAYPETRYGAAHVFSTGLSATNFNHALFDGMIDPETNMYLSEDYTFCRRWRQLGGSLWLDTRSRLTHTGAHDFRGNPGMRYAV
jgi:hypothetical protein